MDESNSTCNKRFEQLGIPRNEEAGRAYREMIVTTPGLRKCISGVMLYVPIGGLFFKTLDLPGNKK